MKCMTVTTASEEDLYGATVSDDRQTVPLEFFVDYLDAVKRNWDSISEFKLACLEEDKDAARSALSDIPQPDELLLWRAPTKGSVFTTKERGFLKS